MTPVLKLVTTAPDSPDPQLVRDSFNLILIVALLGVILVTGLTLLLVLRRNRLARARNRPRPTAPTPDPWEEAGRRAVPEDPSPASDDLGPPTG